MAPGDSYVVIGPNNGRDDPRPATVVPQRVNPPHFAMAKRIVLSQNRT